MTKPLQLIRKGITQGFKGKFNKGQLLRDVLQDGALDGSGDAFVDSTATFNFEGLDIEWSAAYKRANGIQMTDVGILIFAGTIKPPTVPRIDDRIVLQGVTYQVRTASRDPAEATWTCACYLPKAA